MAWGLSTRPSRFRCGVVWHSRCCRLLAVLDSRQLRRFQNEAQAAALLHHPQIVPVYGVGCDRGVHYYAMQLVEGPTLAHVICDLRSQAGLGPAVTGVGRDHAAS